MCAYTCINMYISVCVHMYLFVHVYVCSLSLSLPIPETKLHIIRHQGCVAIIRDCRLQTGYNLSSQFTIAEVSWILRLLAEVMEIA